MARACGLGRSTIAANMEAFGLQPHRSETFKLSKDPLLIDRFATSSAFTSARRSTRGSVRG